MHFEGWRYVLGDFTVCIGRATLKPKQEFRGFAVELHYQPLNDISMAPAVLGVRVCCCFRTGSRQPDVTLQWPSLQKSAGANCCSVNSTHLGICGLDKELGTWIPAQV